MLYLNADHIRSINTTWDQLIDVIRDTVTVMDNHDFAQPLKPYLRYGNLVNRIIAMPAYVGGGTGLAGIKWIASFPGNIYMNRPRAHSVTILNEQDSGKPLCAINTNDVSAIRTAAVSGLIIKEYLKAKNTNQRYTIGIAGFGPIGKTHLAMVTALLGDSIDVIKIYDIKKIKEPDDPLLKDKIVLAANWQECYEGADIFMTCTVSDKPYIDAKPKKGSLHLNVSLRDYKAETRPYMDIILVDDWDEVCRQNTDIENMHKIMGLQKENTLSLTDVVCRHALDNPGDGDVIMFNPMGMAVFDIAIGGYYYKTALKNNIGMMMPD